MNPKFRAFNCNPSPPKKSCFQKSPISSLRIKMLGVEFLRIRVNGWLLMTPLLEFPFPFSPSWILLMMGSTAFSWGIFWLEGSDPKKIHPLGGSVFFRDPKHLELMGMLGVPTKMWSELLFFDSKSWGDVLQVPTWIFFSKEENSKGDESNEDLEPIDLHRGYPFFNIPSSRVNLANTSIFGGNSTRLLQ